jgi:hypothetical protein
MYMNGARMVRSVGLAPLADGMGLFIATPSYDGQMSFNVISTREVLPDIEFFMRCIEARRKRRGRSARRRRSNAERPRRKRRRRRPRRRQKPGGAAGILEPEQETAWFRSLAPASGGGGRLSCAAMHAGTGYDCF